MIIIVFTLMIVIELKKIFQFPAVCYGNIPIISKQVVITGCLPGMEFIADNIFALYVQKQ